MALPKFETPVYSLTIPSTNETFSYRPYTVKEEKALLIAKETGTQDDLVQSAARLLETCIEGLDSRKLTTFDFEYVFLKLRSKSAGEVSDILVNCENCQSQVEMAVQLEDAYISGNMLTEEELTIKLSEDIGVVLQYPLFTQVVTPEESEVERLTKVLAMSIKTIFDKDGVYEAREYSDAELIDFVESLPSGMFVKLTETFKEIPSVVIDSKYVCTACQHRGEIKLFGLDNFF